MADNLFLNLWFRSFRHSEVLQRLACVFAQFPFSEPHPGFGHVSVRSLSWSEPTVLEETFDYRASAEHVLGLASDFLHEDNGYLFEAQWDLWSPGVPPGEWTRQPHTVKFVAHGELFDDGIYEESGHIQIDLGLDSYFLLEGAALDAAAQDYLKQNVEQLLSFSNAIQKNCGISSRLLWSDSDENLAQKLIARVQQLQ